jgi:glycerol uptake facilitator-like aquaporin
MWDLALGIAAGAYVVGSLVNGLLDPNIGLVLAVTGGIRVILSLLRRYKS